jgi:AcrR family transcriptional regulator
MRRAAGAKRHGPGRTAGALRGAPVGRRRTAPRRAARPAPGPATTDESSRARLLRAAAAEFAARGFAGASVDRIARAAAVNKAMIYYHFKSKAALYREIVGDMFTAVGARIRDVAASGDQPEAKVARFVESIALEAEARPHFPAIWFREIAEGGAHLDDKTLRAIAAIVQALVGILQAGVKAGRFRRVHPLVVHGGIVGPIMLFFASAGLRARLERAGLGGAAHVSRDELVAHVQAVTLGVLSGAVS